MLLPRGLRQVVVLSRVARGAERRGANRPRTSPRAFGAPLRFCARVATGLLGLASLLAAHAPEASTATQDPSAQIQQVDLVRLVDRFAQKLQLEVRFERGQLTGTVATRPLENLSDAELWSLTHRALESQGLTTIQLPGEEAITIVKLDEAGNQARFEQQDLSKARAGYVKVLHELRHRSPADVLPTIQQIMSGSGVWAMAVGKTNSILLADLRPKLDQVFELLRVLDVAPPATGVPIRVFPIRNRSALELADFLNRLAGTGFLGPTGPATQVPDPAAVPLAPATQVTPLPATALRAELGRVVLSADATTNCVFAIGDEGLLDKLEGLLKTLDVISSQVMLEVLILNLSDSDATDLGVEIRSIKDSGTIVSLTSLFGLGAPNPAAGLVPPIASGFTSVVLNPGDYSVLLNALQVLNRGRALNIPRILVNSNQKAKLASVLQTPFLSTNATQVVATTTLGGTQDAGTTIEVKPQIAEGDHLTLEYSIILSTFVGTASDPSLPPPRQQNTLNSAATIPDGYTVALGGLETTSETEAINQVPVLGSLPVIGWLFSSESKKVEHSRFFVFIRASILRSSDFQHLKFLSDVEMHRADVDPGWPEVEPILIR